MIVLQPSKLLIDVTAQEFRRSSPKTNIKVVHSNTHPNCAVRAAMKWFNDPDGMLFITHECYDHIPYINGQKRVTAIVDEVPKLVKFFERDMSKTHGLVTAHFDAVPVGDGTYSLLVPKHAAEIEGMVRTRNDQFWEEMKPLTTAVMSGKWDVYVDTRQYEALIKGDDYRLATYAIRKPASFAGFRSVLFTGALFDETLLHHRWISQGIEFRRHDELRRRLRPAPNGELIDIFPVVEGPWSKRMRDALGGDVEKGFREVAESIMGGEPYAWLTNLDRPEFFDDVQSRLPGSPHGLNQYQHLNNAVVVAALNPRPDQDRFLTSSLMGTAREQVRTDIMHLPSFQAAMRTSARNPQNTDRKKFVVPDLATAQAIGRWLPGARVHEPVMAIKPRVGGRPRIHADVAAKQRQYRRRKRAEG